MTKETMIWQTLSGSIAGLAVRNELPETEEQFKEMVVSQALGVLGYSRDDIETVLGTIDCTDFAKVMCGIYTNKGESCAKKSLQIIVT